MCIYIYIYIYIYIDIYRYVFSFKKQMKTELRKPILDIYRCLD